MEINSTTTRTTPVPYTRRVNTTQRDKDRVLIEIPITDFSDDNTHNEFYLCAIPEELWSTLVSAIDSRGLLAIEDILHTLSRKDIKSIRLQIELNPITRQYGEIS